MQVVVCRGDGCRTMHVDRISNAMKLRASMGSDRMCVMAGWPISAVSSFKIFEYPTGLSCRW